MLLLKQNFNFLLFQLNFVWLDEIFVAMTKIFCCFYGNQTFFLVYLYMILI